VLGWPQTVAEAVQWRLQAQQKLLGNIVGMMFPPGVWLPPLPGAVPGARLGQEVLVRRWRQVEDKSPATRSRWQWTWGGDESLCQKDGEQRGMVGLGWSGQEQRVRLGIEGRLLLVVMGDGKLVIPVDFALRRPDPVGPGRPCRDKLTWLRVMLDRSWAALRRRCRRLPPPLVVADSWCGESGLLAHVATVQQGTLLVEGKTSSVFALPDGRRVKGQDLLSREDWPWHASAPLPGLRSARLTATSPTSGRVTLGLVDQPGRERYDRLCRETSRSAPRLIRAWRRRSWIEQSFRTVKPLLAIEACQVQREEAYYGHLVLRLMAAMVLLYTARIACKAKVTLEEILLSLKHDWPFLDSALLE
jgi:hypothetical protein